jgi:hypothetical protein
MAKERLIDTSVVPNNNALSLSIVHNACSVFPSLVMHVCTATKIFLYHIGSSATSNSIDLFLIDVFSKVVFGNTSVAERKSKRSK